MRAFSIVAFLIAPLLAFASPVEGTTNAVALRCHEEAGRHFRHERGECRSKFSSRAFHYCIKTKCAQDSEGNGKRIANAVNAETVDAVNSEMTHSACNSEE
jgi:hypothetical protein